MQKLLEILLRKGVIPLCCGSASCCFALYSSKVSHGAELWLASVDIEKDNNFLYRESIEDYALRLRQHSGACVSMSLISASIALEAYRDWQQYKTPKRWSEMAFVLWQR